MKKEIRGVVPPVVTPLTENHNFGRRSHVKLIEHLISGDVDGLFILGSSSEVVFFTDRRRGEILKAVVESAKGCMPVLAEVIGTGTSRVKEHIKRATDLGVNAVVAIASFYVL